MEEDKLRAFLLLLGDKWERIEKVPNEYCGDGPGATCSVCRNRPWWKIKFEGVDGRIKIGWRKRVGKRQECPWIWRTKGNTLLPPALSITTVGDMDNYLRKQVTYCNISI
jgi:hypothetical protein